jgi:hypothetical protein
MEATNGLLLRINLLDQGNLAMETITWRMNYEFTAKKVLETWGCLS